MIQASRLGKFKTVSQIAALVPLILHYPFFGIDFHLIGYALLYPVSYTYDLVRIDYFRKVFQAVFIP